MPRKKSRTNAAEARATPAAYGKSSSDRPRTSSASMEATESSSGTKREITSVMTAEMIPCISLPVTYVAEEVRGLSELDFHYAAGVAIVSAAFVLLFFLGISRFSAKKAGKT